MFGFKKQKNKKNSKLTPNLDLTKQKFSLLSALLPKDNEDKILDTEQIEDILIGADVGVTTTDKIIQSLHKKPTIENLKQELLDLLKKSVKKLEIDVKKPTVLLMIGINGAGKTTTIGKLGFKFKNQGMRVLLAAGDTYRAAAVAQLQEWGQRNSIEVITSDNEKIDSSALIYDATAQLISKKYQILLADTAGRLHNNKNLMAQLKKIKRVILKNNEDNLILKTILIIDGGGGQNSFNQAQEFNKEIGVNGLIITKLDGTARGGIIFAIADKLTLPIYYIGTGESADDLKEFNPQDFVEAIF
ncbi:MAG: signal recognition particle-docking protein FtsY [Gammaproteobacteria bacterium]|nr:MAG: signal recognition particle-docking protein FtsY [Gammaproteobacteria bacterium]